MFSPAEIAGFRQKSLDSVGKHGGELLSHPTLSSVITDGRLADVAKQILDRDDVVYYGDSVVAIREGSPGYHKDNTENTTEGRIHQLRTRVGDHKPLPY